MTYTKKDYQKFKMALELSITAPSEKESRECVVMAENMAKLFPANVIEQAKMEVQKRFLFNFIRKA